MGIKFREVTYLEVALAGLENAGGAEQHGDVRVVAARVHLPGVLALVLPLHRLLQPTTATNRTCHATKGVRLESSENE